MELKKVLWISRHGMGDRQLECLKQFLGAEVELTVWSDTVERMEQLRPLVEQADAVAAVLPPEKLSCLMELAQGKPVLQGVTRRTLIPASVPGGEPVPVYSFDCWQQILCCRFETSPRLVS